MGNGLLAPDDPLPAVITKVLPLDGYAVCLPREERDDLTIRDSVTFSLPDWEGDGEPDAGQAVVLEGTTLYSRGWRARSARPVQLSN